MKAPKMIHHDPKNAIDVLSAGAAAGAVTGVLLKVTFWLPVVAAFFSIVWSCIRIYESATFKKFQKKWLKRKAK